MTYTPKPNGLYSELGQNLYSPTNDSTGRHQYYGPKNYARDGSIVGVVYAHGAGGDEQDTWSSSSTNIMNIMQVIGLYRPVVACKFGGDLWGNDTNILQVADAWAYLQSQYGANASKVILMGRSMGHLTVANWARQHKTSVAAIACFAGVSDLQNIYAAGANTASINAAYGGSYSDATMGATHNPTDYAASGDLSGIPWRNYYATDDTTVPPSTVTTLAGLIGASAAAISMGTGGHTDTPLANVDIADLVSWLSTQAGDSAP